MSIADAERLKENYLAQLRQLEYDMKAGAVAPVVDSAKALGADAVVHQQDVAAALSERYSVLAHALVSEVLAPERRAWEALQAAWRERQVAIEAGLIGADEAPLPNQGPRFAAVAAMGTEVPAIYMPSPLHEEVHLPGVSGLSDAFWRRER